MVNVFEKTQKLQTLDFVDASFELTLKFKGKFCNYLCQFTWSCFSQHLHVQLFEKNKRAQFVCYFLFDEKE